jgi:hypothetical protein
MNFRVSIIPPGLGNRPGSKLATNVQPYITVHETSNYNAGANAEMHRVFTHQGGGPSRVSFHFVVDDHEAIQLLPLDEVSWHAGDGCDEYPDNVGHDDIGCFASLAIETCVDAGSDWNKTKANLAELIAMIASGDDRMAWGDGRYKSRMSIESIAQHNNWSGKNCPLRIRGEGSWGNLMDMVDRAYAQINGDEEIPIPIYKKPVGTPEWTGLDQKDANGVWWYPIERTIRIADDTTPYAWASPVAEAKAGPRLKAGQSFTSKWMLKTRAGRWWYVASNGYRIQMGKCFEQFRPVHKRG